MRAPPAQTATDATGMELQGSYMPVMDGLQATRLIRSNPHLSGMAVVGLTASADAEDHAQCRGAGMDAVLTKPFNPAHLFATVTQCL